MKIPKKRYEKIPDAASQKKNRSNFAEIWRRLKKSKLAMVSLIFLIALFILVIFAGVIAPYEYDKIDLSCALQMPSRTHIMGTDQYGRDIFSRILYGGRMSLGIALASVVISLVAACIIGTIAGFFKGMVDNILMRIMDVFMAIPSMLLAITIAAAMGTGLVNTIIALSISNIPQLARIVRSSVLLLSDNEYIEAAQTFGESKARIILKHVLPNSLSPIIVQATLKFGDAIITIAGLSFIGLGIAPPTPEWGSILNSGREYIMTFWPLITFPGIMIALTMLAVNLLGDGLRDAMDPRLRQ